MKTPINWTVIETGGGCTALWREHDHDHEWLITKDGDPSAPDDANEPCTLGLSDDGATIVYWDCSCLAEALEIANSAKA